MIDMRRSVVLLAAATTLLAGCSAGQGPAGAAAVIGDHVITVDEVQGRFDAVLRTNDPAIAQLEQQHKLDQVSREILRQEVLHQLTVHAAAREGITVQEDEVTEQVAAQAAARDASRDPQGQTGQDPIRALVADTADPRTLARDTLTRAELARRQAGRFALTFDAVIVQTPQRARELARQIAAQPEKSGEIIRAEGASQRESALNFRVGNTTQQEIGTAMFLYAQNPSVFMISPGADQESTGYRVIYVKTRTAAPAPDQRVIAQFETEDLAQLGEFVLRDQVAIDGLKLSPRYGTWDLIQMLPAPSQEASATSEVLPVSSPAP